LAAIVAAVEMVWPRPVQVVGAGGLADGERSSAWRFSGRWWSKPTTVRRDRPWVELR
jgi:hypothetical protein